MTGQQVVEGVPVVGDALGHLGLPHQGEEVSTGRIAEGVFGDVVVVDVVLAGAQVTQHVQVDLDQPHHDHRQLSFLGRFDLQRQSIC